MPFHPLNESIPDQPRLADLGLLVIRVLVAITFSYYQLASQLGFALARIWDSAEWPLVDQLSGLDLPMPAVIAFGAVGLQVVNLLGVFFGIFTRINALLLAIMAGFVLFLAIPYSPTLNPQCLALYLGIFIGLACGGAGRLSLDHLLAGRRARKRAA